MNQANSHCICISSTQDDSNGWYLQKAQYADLLKLNLVFERPGTVRLREIEILATPLQDK